MCWGSLGMVFFWNPNHRWIFCWFSIIPVGGAGVFASIKSTMECGSLIAMWYGNFGDARQPGRWIWVQQRRCCYTNFEGRVLKIQMKYQSLPDSHWLFGKYVYIYIYLCVCACLVNIGMFGTSFDRRESQKYPTVSHGSLEQAQWRRGS